MRVQVDVLEEIYDEADTHHDEKVNSDRVSANHPCDMAGQGAMTSAPESDQSVDGSARTTRKLWRAEKFQRRNETLRRDGGPQMNEKFGRERWSLEI
mmetsp:Transcript_108965/g.347908  ORF Transcript_108965/g.347908 Transcript_108965/m.347908 type:complete len:97 (+) Transcript_108965:74-364(+)